VKLSAKMSEKEKEEARRKSLKREREREKVYLQPNESRSESFAEK